MRRKWGSLRGVWDRFALCFSTLLYGFSSTHSVRRKMVELWEHLKRYSLNTHKGSHLGQWYGLQSLTLTPYFYKNIYQNVVYVYFYEDIFHDKSIEKSLHNPPKLSRVEYFIPNYKTRYSTPWTFKTGQIISRVVLECGFVFVFFIYLC